jgi:hypothetical protein
VLCLAVPCALTSGCHLLAVLLCAVPTLLASTVALRVVLVASIMVPVTGAVPGSLVLCRNCSISLSAAAVLLAACRAAVSVAVLLACSAMQDKNLLDRHHICESGSDVPCNGCARCLAHHVSRQRGKHEVSESGAGVPTQSSP